MFEEIVRKELIKGGIHIETVSDAIIEELAKVWMNMLDGVADRLPEHPPLSTAGVVSTIRELHPHLSNEELDYVYSQYKGMMRKE